MEDNITFRVIAYKCADVANISTANYAEMCIRDSFQAEWLVNRSGDIRLKAYNETNDRYYTKTNLTTQGLSLIHI